MPKHIIVQAKTTAVDGEFGKLVVSAMCTLTIETRSNDIKLGGHGWPCKDGRDGESGKSFAAGRLACPQGLLLRGWNGTRWMMLAVQGSGVRCPHLKAESNWARVMWVVQDLERRGKHAACKRLREQSAGTRVFSRGPLKRSARIQIEAVLFTQENLRSFIVSGTPACGKFAASRQNMCSP